MQRYFIEQSKQEVTAAPAFSIKGEDVHHIATVMRMSPGDEVICCAKDGHEAKCRIESVTKEEVLLSVIEWTGKHANCPSRSILQTAFQKEISWNGSFKRDRARCKLVYSFSGIAPVVKLDEKGKEKRERWAKIAKEAAEQSHRNAIPDVAPVHTFQRLLESLEDFDKCVVAYEESSKQGETSRFQSVLKSLSEGSSVLMVFGPEGGFTEEEIEALKKRCPRLRARSADLKGGNSSAVRVGGSFLSYRVIKR